MLVNKIILLIILGVLGVSHGKIGFGPGEQEWDYVRVEHGYMFWWLYYTTANVTNYTEKPLIIWLTGGPGSSSTGYGNFEEIGPLDINMNPRNTTWVKDYNMLFIDSPIGSGFSRTVNSIPPSTNEQIALALRLCIEVFLEKLPLFAEVPTYIAAETYGGKAAVEFAERWYQYQTAGMIRSNLKGVILGDAWISPIDSVMGWAPFLYQTGMVDTQGYNKIMVYANDTKIAVDNNDWALATYIALYTEAVIIYVTNNINFSNILRKTYAQIPKLDEFHPEEYTDSSFGIDIGASDQLVVLMRTNVSQALDITFPWGLQSHDVLRPLWKDFMKPVVDKVEYLLNQTNLKVYVYTGQLDLLVESLGTLQWVEKVNWTKSHEWKKAPRQPLVVDKIIEGYVKAYDRFKMFWICRAGSMVPVDNPTGMKAMLDDLTSDAYD